MLRLADMSSRLPRRPLDQVRNRGAKFAVVDVFDIGEEAKASKRIDGARRHRDRDELHALVDAFAIAAGTLGS